MPVAPEEILEAAAELAHEEREVDWRNAASRAYYAAYHRCRRLAQAEGLRIPETDSVHMALVDAFLENLNPRVLRQLGFMLRDCRRRRAEADYEIEASFSKALASIVVRDCERILHAADSM